MIVYLNVLAIRREDVLHNYTTILFTILAQLTKA